MSTSTLTRPATTDYRTAPAALPTIATNPIRHALDLVSDIPGTVRAVLTPYKRFAAWRDLALHAGLLLYGAGAFFFWLHGVARGEKGPAISYWQHWLLDSTIGLIALTPVLFVLLPLIKRYAAARFGSRHVPAAFLATVTGGLFAFITAPGPIVHNLIAGEGKVVARWAEGFFGIDPVIVDTYARSTAESNTLVEVALQVGFGIPVYITAALLAVGIGRALARKGA